MTKSSFLPKTSIFVRMFLPIICIMLLLVGFINVFLRISGTIEALNDNAVDILSKNVQTRGENLQNLMVNYWGNINWLEQEVQERILFYLAQHDITMDELLGDSAREIDVLGYIAGALIETLRTSATTGVFMHFVNPAGLVYEPQNLNGLYFRDYSQLTGIFANVLFLRGHNIIGRDVNVPMETLWWEYFTFDPQHEETWRGFANPQIAAANAPPGTPAVDMSYWGRPHVFDPYPRIDANWQITYTRPILIGGRVVAIIGTDMQLTHFDRHFPARDLDIFDESGYVLFRYDARQRQGGVIEADVIRISGAHLNHILGNAEQLTWHATDREDMYALANMPEMVGVHLPMRLYNPASPFIDYVWVLAAISSEHSLFTMTREITDAITLASLVAVIVGVVLVLFSVRTITRPVGEVIKQLRTSKGESLVTAKTNAIEIDTLTDTINDMIERRLLAERQIREEQQRYLLALESSADTFIEYDINEDILSIYYFVSTQKHEPKHKSIEYFTKVSHDFFHPADQQLFFNENEFEVRIKEKYFDHITGVAPDNGYYWFYTKTIVIRDDDGDPQKIIGTAHENTQSKIIEQVEIKMQQIDANTGFYNRRSGIERMLALTKQPGLTLLKINNFDRLEHLHGLLSGGLFLAQFAYDIGHIVADAGFVVRLNEDELLICYDLPPDEIDRRNEKIAQSFDWLYKGPDTQLTLSVEVLTSAMGIPPNRGDVLMKLNPFDVSNIVGLTLELFERAAHIGYAANMLMGLLGRIFALDRVVVCAYDANFGTNQVMHEWHAHGVSAPHRDIRQVSLAAFQEFHAMLEEDAFVFSSENAPDGPMGILLCIPPNESVSLYCCVTHDQEKPSGGIIFMSTDPAKVWSDQEQTTLNSIAKIIASYINVEKSRSASLAKSRFLSKVSHEIRTPMNAIIGMTHIAMDAAHDDNHLRVDDCLNKINVSANYLLTLINDVLEMSRIESGKTLHIEARPFSLNALIGEIEAVIRFAIESRSTTFTVLNEIRNDRVVGDDNRIKQVLINLLGNANKFTAAGGQITFALTERADGEYYFAVTDTGVGIAADMHESIFNPFEQVETGATPSQQGTGLGLSISRNIIAAMNSNIELTSEINKGSTFSFVLTLPLTQDAVENERTEVATTGWTLENRRILVVDDVAINLEIAAYILEETGATVVTATNGYEAVAAFEHNPPGHFDAILMDLQMPEVDGITASRQIRAMPNRPDAADIPIIALTANAFDEDLKKSMASGLNHHVSKPINEYELMRVLKLFLT